MEARPTLDCRESAKPTGRTLTISGTDREVPDVAAYHAAKVHGGVDTPEFREQLKKSFRREAYR